MFACCLRLSIICGEFPVCRITRADLSFPSLSRDLIYILERTNCDADLLIFVSANTHQKTDSDIDTHHYHQVIEYTQLRCMLTTLPLPSAALFYKMHSHSHHPHPMMNYTLT